MQKEITLITKDGPKSIQAYSTSCPFLFVHRRIDNWGVPMAGFWDVTHEATGLKAHGSSFKKREQGYAYAKRLMELGADFSFTDSVASQITEIGKNGWHRQAREYALTDPKERDTS